MTARRGCLADYVEVPSNYAAGRLDADSEGLLLHKDQGCLKLRLTDQCLGHGRSYWIQVEVWPRQFNFSSTTGEWDLRVVRCRLLITTLKVCINWILALLSCLQLL